MTKSLKRNIISTITSKLYNFRTGIGPFGLQKKYYLELIGLANIKRGDKILDVGCGTGTLGFLAKKKYGSSIDYYAIDPNIHFLEYAQKRFIKNEFGVGLHKAVIESLPMKNESFDFVFCTLVFHHLLPNIIESGLKEINRVLKKDAKLLIFDYTKPKNIIHYFWYYLTYFWTSIIEYGNYFFQGKYINLLQNNGFGKVDTYYVSRYLPFAIYQTKKNHSLI